MNRSEIKVIFLQALIAFAVLIASGFLLIIFPLLLILIWLLSLMSIAFVHWKYDNIVTKRAFQILTKYFYYQFIVLTFGFFFIPGLDLLSMLIPVAVLILALSKTRRESPKFIKWAKYIGLMSFNLVLMYVFLFLFQPTDPTEVMLTIPIITMINSGHAAVFLKLEARASKSRKKIIMFAILAMMIMIAFNMFPSGG